MGPDHERGYPNGERASDAGQSDAGQSDAGQSDAGQSDAGQSDASEPFGHPELVLISTSEHHAEYFDIRWLEYTGTDAHCQLGTGWHEHVHLEDRLALFNAWKSRPPRTQPTRVEVRLKGRDGCYRRFEVSSTPALDGHGTPCKWITVWRDVHGLSELRGRPRFESEQLEHLIAAVPGLICTYETRPDGTDYFSYASDAALDIYGVTPSEMARGAGCVFERIHPDDTAPLAEQIRASTLALTNWHGEFRYQHPVKGLRDIEGFSAPVLQPDGRTVWYGVIFDVTTQRAEQAALEDAKGRATAIGRIASTLSTASSAGEGAEALLRVVCELDGWDFGTVWLRGETAEPICIARFATPPLRTLLDLACQAPAAAPSNGDSQAEAGLGLLGLEPHWLDHDALRQSSDPRARSAYEHGIRTLLCCPLDDARDVRLCIEVGSLEQEHTSRPTIEFVRSIASQVRMWLERLSAEREVRASEARLQALIENMSEGLVVSDTTGMLVYWNPAALRMHGVETESEWRKQLSAFTTTFEIATTKGEVLSVESWPMARILRGEELRNVEHRVRRLDRDWEKVLSYGGCQIVMGDGTTLSFLTISDRTEEVRLYQELQDLNADLETRVAERTSELTHSNRELESFSYSVSHDLRAPLRAMNGYALVLLEDFGPEIPAEAQRMLRVINECGARMGDLIDDLLRLSRLGRQTLSISPIAMQELVLDTLDQSHFPGQDRAVFDIAELPPCMGDAALIGHVWTNLLSNAIKYASGRERIEIRIRGERVEGEVRYTISDNGVGFDMRYQHKLFEIFQRLHSLREFEGTGIGLAIVRRVVERHGGRVWADSTPGHGATFGFALPLRVGHG